MLNQIAKIIFRCEVLLRKVCIRRTVNRLSKKKEKILAVSQNGYRRSMLQVGFPAAVIRKVEKLLSSRREVVVAQIDHDGLFLPDLPLFPGAPEVSEEEFLQRKKFEMQLVIVDGYVGVKKNYGRKKGAFLQELICLHTLLKAGCNVPSILNIDFDELSLTIAFIKGEVVREALVRHGARLRERDFDCLLKGYEQSGCKLTKRQLRAREASKYLPRVINDEYLRCLAKEIAKIKLAGVVLQDVKYGNILIEESTGEPFFIDFERAEYGFHWWSRRALAKKQMETWARFCLLFPGVDLAFPQNAAITTAAET